MEGGEFKVGDGDESLCWEDPVEEGRKEEEGVEELKVMKLKWM